MFYITCKEVNPFLKANQQASSSSKPQSLSQIPQFRVIDQGLMMKLVFLFVGLLRVFVKVESTCSKGCDLALASYRVSSGDSLSYLAGYVFGTTVDDIMSFNPKITNPNSINISERINMPLSCECIDGEFLAHVFSYKILANDTYSSVALFSYANLTTPSLVQRTNSYDNQGFLPKGRNLSVTVNCSCGNSSVSEDYGLFMTYPLIPTDSLSSIAQQQNLSETLLQRYNPGANFNAGSGLVYIPVKDINGSYRPLNSGSSTGGSSASSGISPGVIVCVCVAVAVIVLLGCWYLGCIRRNKRRQALLSDKPEIEFKQTEDVTGQSEDVTPNPGITVDKSVEFSYEELAEATNNFSMANKIGQGGFGAVFYGELRGEKTAVKKMDMQATKEFLAELKVLSHVHHLNLVRLIGYCIEHSLFLVYEYIENGTLSQHLRGSDKAALPWSARLQIALDSARGLEYIHEHTVPVYIHRDIKSPNILIDNTFRAKVADFGLTKLVQVGNESLPTGLQGTFGYMPPEYAQFCEVSPKADVYAFGVVLYELISGKEAVVKEKESSSHFMALATVFENVLSQSDPTGICHLIDPKLGEDYPLDSVLKMAELARACTQDNPELRPTMRSAVVALMSLSSTSDGWDVSSFYEHGVQNLVSGR